MCRDSLLGQLVKSKRKNPNENKEGTVFCLGIQFKIMLRFRISLMRGFEIAQDFNTDSSLSLPLSAVLLGC